MNKKNKRKKGRKATSVKKKISCAKEIQSEDKSKKKE